VWVNYAPTQPIQNASALAAASDLAIVFVATTSSEGMDRPTLYLGEDQDELVEAILQAQPNTVVVVHTPGASLMPWKAEAHSILCAFMPGQEDGNAIAAVLFGDINPSGKLPVTFPASMNDLPFQSVEQYPGVDNEAEYTENLLVGYRWYDAMNVTPLFPFGHGLSYTSFLYSDLTVYQSSDSQNVSVEVTIQNTGSREGAETVQLYLGYPKSAGEPPKVLRRFQKVLLFPTQSQIVAFELYPKDFSIWDVTTSDWSVAPGVYQIFAASSSRDIRLTGSVTINA